MLELFQKVVVDVLHLLIFDDDDRFFGVIKDMLEYALCCKFHIDDVNDFVNKSFHYKKANTKADEYSGAIKQDKT